MQIAIPLAEADFVPLSDHPLKWRWTDRKHSLLPDHVLTRIRPLSPAKAAEVHHALMHLIDPVRQHLSNEHLEDVVCLDASGDIDEVRQWLVNNIPATSGQVIISWDAKTAVLTTNDILCRYWDDFCYPGSDDVTIWSTRDDWAALYHHGEHLCLGRRKAPGAQQGPPSESARAPTVP